MPSTSRIAAAPTGRSYPVGARRNTRATRCSRTPAGTAARPRPGFSLSMSTRALSSCITSSERLPCTFSIVVAEVGAGLVGGLLAGDEGDVAGRQHALVVLEQHVVVGGEQLRVGREQDRQVGVALVEHLVAQADVDRREVLTQAVEPVVLLEPGQAVDPLAALRRPVQGQVLVVLEVGDRGDPELLGRRGEHPDRVRARERRRRVGDQALRLEVRLGLVERRLRRRRGRPRARCRRTRSARSRCTRDSR